MNTKLSDRLVAIGGEAWLGYALRLRSEDHSLLEDLAVEGQPLNDSGFRRLFEGAGFPPVADSSMKPILFADPLQPQDDAAHWGVIDLP